MFGMIIKGKLLNNVSVFKPFTKRFKFISVGVIFVQPYEDFGGKYPTLSKIYEFNIRPWGSTFLKLDWSQDIRTLIVFILHGWYILYQPTFLELTKHELATDEYDN